MRRRDFLRMGLAGLGAGCARRSPTSSLHRRTRTLSVTERWGDLPDGVPSSVFLPESARPKGVLELYMLGGVSPWESFYTVPEYGNPDAVGTQQVQQWWSFQNWGGPTVPEFDKALCGASSPLYSPFATDALGMTVNLGPFVRPLRDRPDLLARMRVWVMFHDLQPHEAGIPLAITGHRLGIPQQTSLASHVQRYMGEHAADGRTAPHAYTILQGMPLGNRLDTSWATGLHPATSRPLVIRYGPGSGLAERLNRTSVSAYREPLDDLVAHYTQQVQSRFANGSSIAGTPLRADGLADYDHARSVLRNHEDLAQLITADYLTSSMNSRCKGDPIRDETVAGLRLASHLLTAPDNAARYVMMCDGGLYPDPLGMGYDSHPEHVFSQGANIVHAMDAVANQINRPDENNPNKLDLDKHFVLLNTEFGRSPFPEFTKTNPIGLGTNHWPWGYVVVGLGSFVDEERSGIVGAIGPEGHAVHGTTPAEHRAAMLLAMGIWPFTREGFGVGDIRGVDDRVAAAMKLRADVLGYPA
ncbi:MAG: hypothetical protein ACI9OJ_001607 [Myxococcota bacterium]|jgi:hypothetical protein